MIFIFAILAGLSGGFGMYSYQRFKYKYYRIGVISGLLSFVFGVLLFLVARGGI